jgi:hypothetical protein
LNRTSTFALILLAVLISACSHEAQGVRFLNGSASNPKAEPIRNFSADQMRQAIVGKTFQYTRSDGNGFVTYNADGTFDYTDDTKGAGKGKWSASGDQFCEAYGSTPMACGIFKSTGDAYFAANSRLVEMKV